VPEYWVSLGMARRRQDNTSGARKAYETALDLHADRYKQTKTPEELVQQAFVLALLGKKDDALKLLNKGLKDHPDSVVIKKMADPRGLPRTFQTEEFKALAL
jgi:tetratricopeptide (TPR) repeat protein